MTARLTDKQLFDEIERRQPHLLGDGDLIAYAQLRSFERIAHNLNGIIETLAVIRADHKPEPTEFIKALKFAAFPATPAKIRSALRQATDAKGGKG